MPPKVRRRAGIRKRVTVTATAVVAATLLVSGVLLTFFLYQSLVAGLDSAGRDRALQVASLAAAGTLPTAISNTGEDNALVQVVDSANRVLSATANVEGQSAILGAPPAAAGTSVTLAISALSSKQFRIVAEPVQLPSGQGWVYVASALTQVDAAVLSLVGLFAVGLPLVLIIVALALWHAVGQVLRPVEAIRERAASIGAADLSRRVPVPPTSDEIARLAETMNDMLDRLDDAARRQRQFIGDASHELRSPLAALRAQVEVALAHPEDPTTATVLSRVQDQAARMSTLIDDLLFLASSAEQAPTSSAEMVYLDELVLAEMHRLRELGGPRIELARLNAARLHGSGRDLARLLRNLGDNARDHARSRVAFSLSTNGVAELTISDDGPGIPVPERERVFERFTRLDDARQRNLGGGGAGVGLSIARQIVLAHGGSIAIGDRPDGAPGAVFLVRLPIEES